jgi:nucleoside-diphosphate kinase
LKLRPGDGRPQDTELAFVLLRPEAVLQRVVGAIFSRIERLQGTLVGVKEIHVTEAQIRSLYARPDIGDRLSSIVDAHLAGPVIVAIFSVPAGLCVRIEDEVEIIRAAYATSRLRNFVHASDSPANAEREIAIFFAPRDITRIPLSHPLGIPAEQQLPPNARDGVARRRVAIEGISCSGKTTLAQGLAQFRAAIIPESTTFCSVFPQPPSTPEQARANEQFCLEVERTRQAFERTCCCPSSAVVYDRTYLSVLAISWSYLPECGANTFRLLVTEVLRTLQDEALCPPDLYLYIDLPLAYFEPRNRGRASPLTGFWADLRVLARQREFFEGWFNAVQSVPVCRLDARLKPRALLQAARAAIARVAFSAVDHRRYRRELKAHCMALLEIAERKAGRT